MSESPTPLPPPLPPVAAPISKSWWFVWIFCTVILPGVGMTLGAMLPGGEGSAVVCGVAALAMLILHVVSSIKLSQGASSWVRFGLIFGGWILMLASFFAGCLLMLSQAR